MKKLLLSFLIHVLKKSAQHYLSKTRPLVIWVTWSVGKTSCRLIIADTLKKLLPQEYIYTSPKNFNSDLGLSLSILWVESYKPTIDWAITALIEWVYQALFLSSKPSILVLEYGIDKPWDMDLLLDIAAPDIGILTTLDLVHSENFPDGQQGIYNEKIKLIQAAKDTVFLNSKIQQGVLVQPSSSWDKTTILFGEEEWEWQVGFSEYQVSLSWDKINSSFTYRAWENVLVVTTNVTWTHNITYMSIGITIADIISHRRQYSSIWSLQTLHLPVTLQAWRFTLLTTTRGDIVIDSTYNAAPKSMRKVIGEWLALQQHFFPNHETLCILWEMKELGESSKQEHIDLAVRLSDKVHNIVGVWGNSVYMTDYLIWLRNPQNHVFRCQNNLEAPNFVSQIIEHNPEKRYLIIIKWSQSIYMEEIAKSLVPESHRSELPRQEPYRVNKKRFTKQFYESTS